MISVGLREETFVLFVWFICHISCNFNIMVLNCAISSCMSSVILAFTFEDSGAEGAYTAYETFYNDTPPIPKRLLGKALRLILRENSFQFNKRNYLQTHGTAMGTKMAVAFTNIFMGEIEKQILNESAHKPLAWKRYIDDIIGSLSKHDGDGSENVI